MKTTLNQIRAHRPCRDGWQKLLRGLGKAKADDEPLWIDQVGDINGLDDAVWCLRAVEGFDREIRLFSVWCARRVQHLMTDPRSIVALDVAERHARGDATNKELALARAAARSAAGSTARSAARSVARAAARAAARSAARSVAWSVLSVKRTSEKIAQAEELWRICREMREAKP